MTITLTYHGHGTLSLDVNGTKLVVDPFLAPNNPAAKISAEALEADYILITHGHADHTLDVVPLAQRTGATCIANFEIGEWLQKQGITKVHQQHIGGGFTHPFGHVKLTHAFHGSMLPDGSNGGMPAGFLLTIDGKRVYISGDTALYSDMALYGAMGIDLAVICIGDNFTMGPDDALAAVKLLKPKAVIPYHYDTWPLINVDAVAWAARVSAETDSEPILLPVEGKHALS